MIRSGDRFRHRQLSQQCEKGNEIPCDIRDIWFNPSGISTDYFTFAGCASQYDKPSKAACHWCAIR